MVEIQIDNAWVGYDEYCDTAMIFWKDSEGKIHSLCTLMHDFLGCKVEFSIKKKDGEGAK